MAHSVCTVLYTVLISVRSTLLYRPNIYVGIMEYFGRLRQSGSVVDVSWIMEV